MKRNLKFLNGRGITPKDWINSLVYFMEYTIRSARRDGGTVPTLVSNIVV